MAALVTAGWLCLASHLPHTLAFAPPSTAPRALRAARMAPLPVSSAWAWPARRQPTPLAVVVDDQSDHTALAVPPEQTQLVSRFKQAWHGALTDKRTIDELVACFQYAGQLTVDGRPFEGQGAVKRGLSDLLHLGDRQNRATSASFAPSAKFLDSGAVEVQVSLDTAVGDAAGTTKLALRLLPDAACAEITRLEVSTLEAPTPAAAEAEATATTSTGVMTRVRPKWETFDGRVRQRIWQHTGLFEPGNTFLLEKLELTTGRLLAIVDRTVWDLHGEKMSAWADSVDIKLDAVVAPGNEDQKTMDNCLFMLDELKRLDPLRRSEPVLAVGGGVLTDVAGFACALWRRGVPWCRVPTTLLGMVDASVGIKVAVNYHRKNGVGHFFSPLHTFVDAAFLGTVAKADIRSGCGEIMKAALVHDERLFDLMEEHGERLIDINFMEDPVADEVIKFSVDTMLECIGPDLWEESLCRPMDFGHSFSRTLEADESFKLRHGEAVAVDCIMSAMIAEEKGLMSKEQAQRTLDLYAKLGLPCSIQGITSETYKRATREITVHRDGLLRAPLPMGIGKCAYVDEITDEEVEAAFARLSAFMDEHPEVLWDPSKSFSLSAGGAQSAVV